MFPNFSCFNTLSLAQLLAQLLLFNFMENKARSGKRKI